MTIPIHTTHITVLRVPTTPDLDPLDTQPAAEEIAVGVRAHISSPRGAEETQSGGQQEVVTWRLSCDPTDLRHTDQIRDERTGEIYEVLWSRDLGFSIGEATGMEHIEAGVKQVKGQY